MKNQVLYSSKINPDNNEAGKKDAVKLIADSLAKGAGLVATYIGNYSKIRETNVLFIGCDVKGGKISQYKNLTRVLNEVTPEEVKVVVVFSVTLSGTETAMKAIKAILDPKGIKVEENEFSCKGPTLFANKGHPTDQEKADAKAFAAEMVSKYRDTSKASPSMAAIRYSELE